MGNDGNGDGNEDRNGDDAVNAGEYDADGNDGQHIGGDRLERVIVVNTRMTMMS